MFQGSLLHDLHRQLVVIGCNVGSCVDWCKLMLSRRHFVMLCLCQDAQFPKFFVQIFHKSSYARFDHAEVMVVHLLSFWRFCAKQRPASEPEVLSFVVHFFCNEEILLLRSHRRNHPFCGLVAKKPQNTQGFFAQHFHRPKKRCLFVQSRTSVRTECRWYTKGLSFDKCIRRWIPCGIASGLKGRTQAAARERGCVRLAFDQFFSGELHDDTAVRRRGNEAVVFFCGNTCEWLEPVRKVCCTMSDCPFFHCFGNGIGNTDIQFDPFIDRFPKRSIDLSGEIGTHDAVIKYQASEILRYSTHFLISFSDKNKNGKGASE